MKKTWQIITLLAFCTILISLSLSACGNSNNPPAPTDNSVSTPSSNTSLESDTHNIDIDSYKEQLTYYMTLSESLQNEILILKEESYISACEKELKISDLEKKIESLQDTILTMDKNGSAYPEDNKLHHTFDQMAARADFEYEKHGDKITITKYIGNTVDVTVPSAIDGIPVSKIGDGAFKGNSVRSVIIPSGVTEIGWFAFEGCAHLESISLPSSVISIGYGSFNSCSPSVTIRCNQGSYAESYANSWGISVEIE